MEKEIEKDKLELEQKIINEDSMVFSETLVMKEQETEQKVLLKLSNDPETEYLVKFDIYKDKYIYITLNEVSAYSPFKFLKSYSLSELQEINNIYRVYDNIGQVKEDLIKLFDAGRITLKSDDLVNEIKMEIKMNFMVDVITVSLSLTKVMNLNIESLDKKLELLYLKVKELNKNIEEYEKIQNEMSQWDQFD